MNYRADVVKFFFFGGGAALIGEERLLESGAYFENLTFWRGACQSVGAHYFIYSNLRANSVIWGKSQISRAKVRNANTKKT